MLCSPQGHAAPILYAAWAEAGYVKEADLLNLRKIDCELEGHPTPVSVCFLLGVADLGFHGSGGSLLLHKFKSGLMQATLSPSLIWSGLNSSHLLQHSFELIFSHTADSV